MAATTKKLSYEFTTDDDELDEPTVDQSTMCNFYKLSLPANASILSRQIAKSQAKRAEREERRRRRIDLSTVREQDENNRSTSEEQSMASPAPPKNDEPVEEEGLKDPAGGRSRIDSAPLDVKLKRKASLPEEDRVTEPMDEEEVQLLAMLLSGYDHDRKFSLPVNLNTIPQQQQPQLPKVLPSPGLPRMPPSAKVSEWLLERSNSPDNVSVGTSVMLEDSGLVLNGEEDEDDVFFDANDEGVNQENGKEEEEKKVSENDNDVVMLEHEIEGLSLNRNMAMTQSLVRVEEETVTDGGHDRNFGRSTSVSPRPITEQFVRGSTGSATFNVKHSTTLSRNMKLLNGNSIPSQQSTTTQLTTTPISSRAGRSVLRVHNVNSMLTNQVPKTNGTLINNHHQITNKRGFSVASGVRKTPEHEAHIHSQTHIPAHVNTPSPAPQPPQVFINPSTPSRPASVASSVKSANVGRTSNLEGLQDLIHMQEEALRRAAFESSKDQIERKLSWHSDNDANRQSTSTHSSVCSLSSSKSIDGANSLNRMSNGGKLQSKIPAPRSRLPTPRGSNLPKRVSIGIQTDIPWPPPCVLRHRSHSVPMVTWTEEMEEMDELEEQEQAKKMNVSEYVERKNIRNSELHQTPHRLLVPRLRK